MIRSNTSLKLIAVLAFTIFLSACREKTYHNPYEVYKRWAGSDPSSDVEVIHGKYWESAHWSKEYVLFIELKASKGWVEEFAKQNKLVKDSTTDQISGVPDWFNPTKEFLRFRRKNDMYGSRYYFNLKSDKVFIFEAQL